MRSNSLKWFLLTLILLAGAAWFWILGERKAAETTRPVAKPAPTNAVSTARPAAPKSLRLSNTTEPLASLIRNNRAILLRNALIDTAKPRNLDIPAELRSTNGHTFIVQSDGPLNAAFYAALDKAGARFISYIPNNAALVQADSASALGNLTVIPYEPYYKLSTGLLEASLNHAPITNALRVLTPPGSEDQALAEIHSAGWAVIGRDSTPLGPEFILQIPGADPAIAAAQWPLSQEIEPFLRRQPLNDLTRVRLGVSTNTLAPTNYLGLNGANVFLNLNDTGADATHPDLQNRILNFNADYDGHGTHVAGILIGDGTESASVSNTPHLPSGSKVGASYRGMAPQAKLFVQQIDLVLGPYISDEFLQSNASFNLTKDALSNGDVNNTPTNGFISNNSWGSGNPVYDLQAASYDAAVRDAQRSTAGEQAMTYVFAAGNSGSGSGNGIDGIQSTISSPGTAKNVITVGAIDMPRHITNKVSLDCATTNQIFLPETSDSNLVAYFSSCGNVAPGVEGPYGRFKPDVVAPGVFVLSARATNFVDPTNQQFLDYLTFPGQTLQPGKSDAHKISVPADAFYAWFQVVPNELSPNPFPTFTITAGPANNPTLVSAVTNALLVASQLAPGGWLVSVKSTNTHPLSFDFNVFIIETNYQCDFYTNLSNISHSIGPFYRYETGTSMSAPAVAGTLALIQQWFVQSNHVNPSPALLKALLINGARSLGNLYDFDAQPSEANEQGWGLVNLPNSLPRIVGGFTNMVWLDQSQSTPLQTGQSVNYTLSIPSNTLGLNRPLRFTLVWTDPPGNPAAGVALVNDLDLIVTDATHTNVYIGNNFHSGEIYTEVSTTNDPTLSDTINNVENVYINTVAGPLIPPYTVTIRAKRVNVNAVTTQTNNIEQDFALVVSTADLTPNQSLTLTPLAPASSPTPVTFVSNGIPALGQLVGANSPYDYKFASGLTNGTANQWHFFVFSNDATLYPQIPSNNVPYTNVAFITFLPPNLSIPRVSQEADIDLYVSTDHNLTNLDANVIYQAITNGTVSRNRGGTEAVVITQTNSDPKKTITYYVGVKSEDQQAAEFGFLAIASLDPFSDQDQNGNIIAHGKPVPAEIPDGSFDRAGMVSVFAVTEGETKSINIRHVQVDNSIEHQNSGDLVGALNFQGLQVVLHNHNGFNTNEFVYDDEPESATSATFGGLPLTPTDGPGSLKSYIGLPVRGFAVWRLDETDNALGQVGRVLKNDISIEAEPPNTGNFTIKLEGFGSYYGYAILPTDATNFTIIASSSDGGAVGPISVYTTNDVNVTTSDDHTTRLTPVTNIVDSAFNPPITGGVWYYLIHNDSAFAVSLNVFVGIKENLTPDWIQTVTNSVPVALKTDAHTQSQICITNTAYAQQVVALDVGVRIDDTNLDDLVLHLQSPQGTSVLLFENRGGPAVTNLGLDATNRGQYIYTVFTEDTNRASTLVKFTPYFAKSNVYAPLPIFSGFEPTVAAGVYTNGQSPGGWTVLTNQVGVVADVNTAYDGSNFLALTTGRITHTYATVAGAAYQFIYYCRGPGIIDWWPGDGNANDIIGPYNGTAQNVVYDDGKVGRGFKFDRKDSSVVLGQTGNFGTGDFSVDYWFTAQTRDEAFMEKRLQCSGNVAFWGIRTPPTGLPQFEITGNGVQNFTTLFGVNTMDDGVWHHLTWIRQGTFLRHYFDGRLAAVGDTGAPINVNNSASLLLGTSICVGTDGTIPFGGAADELDLWTRALSPAEIAAIYNAGSAGKYSTNSVYPNMWVTLDGYSTNLIINNSSVWIAFTNSFIATNGSTTIEFNGNSALSMLLDDVQLVQVPLTNYGNYYFPEETMSPFIGQDPEGCWTLDVWDTRLDSALPTDGFLKSWTLDMTFSSTNVNLIVLTNHAPYTNVAAPNNLVYFAFDVPSDATLVTNSLTNITVPAVQNTPLSLVFNQSALPTGSSQGDVDLLTTPSGGTPITGYVLSETTGGPLLAPGRRYYLAVLNPNPLAAQSNVVRVDTAIVPTNAVTVLTNGVLVRATNDAGTAQYFSFNVPPEAVSASFQVVNALDGEMDLYARYGLPLPGPSGFAYRSSINNSSNQPIIITRASALTTNSSPVPLQSGTWYLTLTNPGASGPRRYEIIASYLTDTNAFLLIPLTNAVSYTNVAAPGYPTNVFYSFTNQPGAAGVRFVLTNLALVGNVDLVVGLGALPTPSQSYSGSFNPGTADERVQVGTNSTLPSMTNTWYLAVPNDWTNKVKYTITAYRFATPPVTNYPSVAPKPQTGGEFALSWVAVPGATYEIDYSTNLVDWTPVAQFVASNRDGMFTDPAPMTNRARYYRLRQLPP